jgi:putative phage-type endonuclease
MAFKVLASTNQMEHQEWLEQRKKGLGGSDIAALFGLNKWKSAIKLYLEKIGEAPEQEAGEAAYWGNVLEEVVAQEFAKRTGMKVRRRNAILQHEEYDYMLANVDRLIVGKKEGLECKTASEYLKGEWDEEQVPDAYFIQCQWYMFITGYDLWHLAVLIGGNKFRHFEVKRDDELIEILKNKAVEFWTEHVIPKNPPPFDGSQASTDLLSALYPDSTGQDIDLPGYLEEKLKTYDYLKEQLDEVKEEKQAIENEIKGLMGESERGFIGERKITWKTVKSQRLDSKALKKDHPDLFEEYAKESSSRRFTIK